MERPLRASITGIDGAGKSTVSSDVVKNLGKDYCIGKIVRPVYVSINGVEEKKFSRLLRVVDIAHGLGDIAQSRRLSLAANAIDVVTQGRIIEPHIEKTINPDLILGARDYLIDPSVYAIYYSPRIARLPMKERIDFFQKLTGTDVRDIVFFLTVPPEEAVERIERRIQAESSGESKSLRPKWKHMHENVEDLTNIQREYYFALKEIEVRGSPKIVIIDTSDRSQEEVSTYVADVLKECLVEKQTSPIPVFTASK